MPTKLNSRSGGVNDYEIYWWGLRRWANQQAAKQIAYNLGHESSAMVSLTIPGLVTLLGGSGGTAAAFCGALGIAACVGSAYLADIERDINYYNNPRGVVIDLYWCLYCSVYSQ